MKLNVKIDYLGKKYNAEINGKFERSEIRHLIQQLDNAII